MLMSTQANRYAFQLLDARANVQSLPPLSAGQLLSTEDGYDIAKRILDIRTAQGELAIGRKIGFANRTIQPKYGVTQPICQPIWAPLFDTTVRYADDNCGIQSLLGALQPRIEPEIVFKLGRTPAPEATLEELADCLEWMAHGLEIAVCPFPDWKFDAIDAIAAFGLHGALIVGEPKMLSAASRQHLADMLANASVSLSCDSGEAEVLCAAGYGSDVLNSPVHALWQLHQLLQSQPQFSPLSAGEIITTGTWTDPLPIAPGQIWMSAFSGIGQAGLTLSLV